MINKEYLSTHKSTDKQKKMNKKSFGNVPKI